VTAQGQDEHSESPRLIAVAGSHPSEFPLNYDEILIGSGPGNDLVVQDATVSRHHARLVRDASGYRLTDFETINGTYVNGERITGTVAVAYGDELGFGTARYALHDVAAASTLADSGSGNGGSGAGNGDLGSGNGDGFATYPSVEGEAAPLVAASEPENRPAEPPLANGGTVQQDQPQIPSWRPEAPEPVARRRMRPLVLAAAVAVLFVVAFVLTKYARRYGPPLQSEEPANFAMNSRTGTAASASAVASPVESSVTASSMSASASPHATPHARHLSAEITPLPTESAEEASIWLLPLNRYRGMAHLLFVNSDPEMTMGARNHARYLVKNYRKQLKAGVNLGALTHTEDPASPWFTTEGSAAASVSDTHFAVGPDSFRPSSRSWAFDSWMTAPFHRLWILNPQLRRVGYGEYCDRGVCGAVLEVRAPSGFAESAAPLPYPVEFPPNGSIVRMTSAQGEWPSPLSPCTGYSIPVGLPLTLQLSQIAQTQFSGYTLTLNGTAPAAIEACGFNATTYHNPDPVAERQAQATLRNVGAIVIVPRSPLEPGSYTASINASGQQYTWSFTVSP